MLGTDLTAPTDHAETDPAAAAEKAGDAAAAAGMGAGRFAVEYAPPGWTTLVEHLKNEPAVAATDAELVDAGLARYTRRGTTIDHFRDRLVFGLHNDQQQLVGFVGRAAPGTDTTSANGSAGGRRVPKYLNTPETAVFTKGAVLFGAPETADLRQAGAVFVRVEGPLDAIAVTLAGSGRHVGVAPLGTALTDHQADQLATPAPTGLASSRGEGAGLEVGTFAGPRLLVATDNDPAGRKAAEADYWKLITRGVDPRELPIPGANDPAELYHTNPVLLATLLDLGEHAPSLAQVLIDTRIDAWSKDLANQWTHARLGAAPLLRRRDRRPATRTVGRAGHLHRRPDR